MKNRTVLDLIGVIMGVWLLAGVSTAIPSSAFADTATLQEITVYQNPA